MNQLSNLIKNKDIKSLKNFNVKINRDLRKILKQSALISLNYGKESAREELGVSPVPTSLKTLQKIDFEIDEMLKARQEILTKKIKDTVKTFLLAERNYEAEQAVFNTIKDQNKTANSMMADSVTGMNISIGRRNVFKKNKKNIKGMMRSEVLDERVCDMCMALDGRVFPPDDKFTEVDQIHSRCRGIWVTVLKDEAAFMPAPKPLPQSIANRFNLVNGKPQINAFKQFKRGAKVPLLKTSRAVEKIKDGEQVGVHTVVP